MDIYTDGACSHNPGPGGWGVVLPNKEYLHGKVDHTTNNQMELTAVIKALDHVKNKVKHVRIHTDSKYVSTGITTWIHGWKANGWKTSNKKPVKNEDLWKELDRLLTKFDKVEFIWVKAHSGNLLNEQADRLATTGTI